MSSKVANVLWEMRERCQIEALELDDVAELQRVPSREAAGQEVTFASQDVTQLRGTRRGTFDTLFDVGVAGSTEVA
jgi:hypothetical protein